MRTEIWEPKITDGWLSYLMDNGSRIHIHLLHELLTINSIIWTVYHDARSNQSVRAHKVFFHNFQFGYSEGCCSTYHILCSKLIVEEYHSRSIVKTRLLRPLSLFIPSACLIWSRVQNIKSQQNWKIDCLEFKICFIPYLRLLKQRN